MLLCVKVICNLTGKYGGGLMIVCRWTLVARKVRSVPQTNLSVPKTGKQRQSVFLDAIQGVQIANPQQVPLPNLYRCTGVGILAGKYRPDREEN